MVFTRLGFHDEGGGAGPDLDMHRYCTEEQARAGHEEVVTLIRATLVDVEDGLDQEERPR